MTIRHLVRLLTAAAIVTLAAVQAAEAQAVGVRAGVSGSPDQFFFGAHADVGPVAERVTFRPNLEIGVGNDITLIALNFEFVYRVPITRSQWNLYAGGGPALNIARARGNTNSGGGLNVLLGVQHERGLMFEFKVGAIDSPSVKFAVGYTVGR